MLAPADQGRRKEHVMGGAIGRVRGFFKSHLKLVAGSAVIGLGVSAALAVATVPDNNGTVHGCYQVVALPAGGVEPAAGPNLRVIDTEPPASQTCDPANELPITINGRGPTGPPGPAGAAGQEGRADDCHSTVGHFTLSRPLSSNACAIRLVHLGTAIAGRQGQAGTTEFEITRLVDNLSPELTKATAKGTIFKSAAVQVYKPGTTTVGANYKLSNATISSDKISLGLNQQLETLTLIAVAKKGT
jgi:hypothetical protein